VLGSWSGLRGPLPTTSRKRVDSKTLSPWSNNCRFHFSCVGLTAETAAQIEAYSCDMCEQMGMGSTRPGGKERNSPIAAVFALDHGLLARVVAEADAVCLSSLAPPPLCRFHFSCVGLTAETAAQIEAYSCDMCFDLGRRLCGQADAAKVEPAERRGGK
jgi:hypothetical protein